MKTCKIIDNKVYTYHKIVFYAFMLGDVEDPDIYAAGPIWDWQQTEQGKFVMQYAESKPEWNRHIDHAHYGYRFAITAVMEEKKLTEYYLKFGKPTNRIIN